MFLGICFVIVVLCNVVFAFVCLATCKARDRLLLLIEGKDEVIEGLTKANREKSKTIAEFESLIAKSEALMQEYDEAFKPIAALMSKYPNETKG